MTPMCAILATLSQDACALWSIASGNSVTKQRSLYSKDGNHFLAARFSADGQSIVTLHKDGDLAAWSLDNGQQITTLDVSLEVKTPQLTCFEVGVANLVASGSCFPYLLVKSLSKGDHSYFKLPVGCRGVDRLQMLRDQNLLALLSEGFFYLLDLSYAHNEGKITVKLNLQIPHEVVKCFDID